MIGYIDKITEIGLSTFLLCIILLMLIIVGAKELFNKFMSALGFKSTKSIDWENLMERVDTMENEIDTFKENRIHDREQSFEIQRQLTENQNDIKESLNGLKKMIIKKDIDDMRWDILDFGSGVIANRPYSKEQYDHVFEIYQNYENVLEENGMENGRVDMSMDFIRKRYAEKLENGFD